MARIVAERPAFATRNQQAGADEPPLPGFQSRIDDRERALGSAISTPRPRSKPKVRSGRVVRDRAAEIEAKSMIRKMRNGLGLARVVPTPNASQSAASRARPTSPPRKHDQIGLPPLLRELSSDDPGIHQRTEMHHVDVPVVC